MLLSSRSRTFQGRHYRTGEPVEVVVESGTISHVTSISKFADPFSSSRWVAPGLVDIQVNGFAGVDFQQDGLTLDNLLHVASEMRKSGCLRWFVTLISDEWPRMLSRFRHLKAIRDSSEILSRAIPGWHIEGPFLSAVDGYRGAHSASAMRNPDVRLLDDLNLIRGEDPLLLTIAPELPGSLPFIRRAVGLGIVVSLGHTNASSDALTAALAAGATGFTHLGNAMPRTVDRHDNIVVRALDYRNQLTFGLIPDTFHLPPPFFRLLHRVIPSERIYYTTDAMAAAAAPPGRYTLADLVLQVGPDEVARLPGFDQLAGSALRAIVGVKRAAGMLGEGVGWRDVWDRFSVVPAGFVGLESRLEAGSPAGVVLVSDEGDIHGSSED